MRGFLPQNSLKCWPKSTDILIERKEIPSWLINVKLRMYTQCSTMREAKADRKAYIENEHICPMIRKRRYPIHNNTVC